MRTSEARIGSRSFSSTPLSDASDLRLVAGVGAGVRWKSPVGPVQADLAYGVKPRKIRLHLSVGFVF